ncbi:MAG: flagellar biosynthesis protein FlhB [Planctomycetes bacterium]|nr:flagellar biosynthesis protein FlhB [Planctomycetota bacterium]
MAEDQDQRTEQPTEKRLHEASERGQVIYSNELTQSVLLLSGLALVTIAGAPLFLTLQEALRDGLAHGPRGDFDVHGVHAYLIQQVGRIAPAVLPILGGIVAAAAIISYFQVGVRLRSQALEAHFDRLNPAAGMSRLFSPRALIQITTSLVKLAIILGIVYGSSGDLLDEIIKLGRSSVRASFGRGISLALSLLLRIGIASLLVGGADYLYQRWQYFRDLRMTKEEVRDENKQYQGDPAIKARIKRAQRIAARQRMLKNVPKATVVITNPTHFAIALRYRRPGGLERPDEAPIVVAKGADFLAKRIREIATEAGVPIVENPPLARALYKTTDVGTFIPGDLYKAVAEVLAFVFKLSGGTRRS